MKSQLGLQTMDNLILCIQNDKLTDLTNRGKSTVMRMNPCMSMPSSRLICQAVARQQAKEPTKLGKGVQHSPNYAGRNDQPSYYVPINPLGFPTESLHPTGLFTHFESEARYGYTRIRSSNYSFASLTGSCKSAISCLG